MISAEKKAGKNGHMNEKNGKSVIWWGSERKQTYWKNLKAFTVPPELENRTRRSSSDMSCLQNMTEKWLRSPTTDTEIDKSRIELFTHGMFDRCSVAEGGKMFWKFLEPGFLKRCSGELVKSFVRPWSSKPSLGNWTVWCFDIATRMIFEYIFWPFRWLIAEVHPNKEKWGGEKREVSYAYEGCIFLSKTVI